MPANQIIAGHGRVEAAKILGWNTVPALRLSHLSEVDKRAYILADNKLAEAAGWDPGILAIELQGLLDIDFDIELTGFKTAEIDLIFDDARKGKDQTASPEDGIPDPPPNHLTVSRPGDLWALGDHRLLCGNTLETQSFQQVMSGEKAQMVFSDPPYNVPIDGHVSGLGRVCHREFAMASGEMNEAQFTQFLQTTFGHLAANSAAGSIHFSCMDWRHLSEALQAGRGVYSELKNVVVWNKTNGGMGSFYRSKHELILVWKNGTAPHINNFELGQHGRYRTNVWDYAGVNTFRSGRLEELGAHPTAKPVASVAVTRRCHCKLICSAKTDSRFVSRSLTKKTSSVRETAVPPQCTNETRALQTHSISEKFVSAQTVASLSVPQSPGICAGIWMTKIRKT
jgi:hypothetical protein